MSRGRGAVERALLAAVKRHRLVSVPAVIMWEVQHGNPQWDPYEESSLRSFRRAACRLEDQGLLRVWYFDLPSMYTVWGGGRNPRATMCVCPPGADVDDRSAVAMAKEHNRAFGRG